MTTDTTPSKAAEEAGSALASELHLYSRPRRAIARAIDAFAAAETAKLREALAYYASPEAWSRDQVEGPNGDYGDRARAALSTTPATPATRAPTIAQVVSTIEQHWSSDTKTATAEAVMALFGAPAEPVATDADTMAAEWQDVLADPTTEPVGDLSSRINQDEIDGLLGFSEADEQVGPVASGGADSAPAYVVSSCGEKVFFRFREDALTQAVGDLTTQVKDDLALDCDASVRISVVMLTDAEFEALPEM